MSRHRFTVGFFRDFSGLMAAFEGAQPEAWHDPVTLGCGASSLSWEERVAPWARQHAEDSESQWERSWWSATDPRDPADNEVAELVRHVWREALLYAWPPPAYAWVAPARAREERPVRIPRVDGVRYYPVTAQLHEVVSVPDAVGFAVFVRDDEVADDDWTHICGLADPGGLTPYEHESPAHPP